MLEIFVAVALFVFVVLALGVIILLSRSVLVPSGDVHIIVNGGTSRGRRRSATPAPRAARSST